MISGRNAASGVEFVDEEDGTVVFTIGADTASTVMSGTAPAVADSAAADVATLVSDFNALLAALRTRGVIA